MAPSNARTRGGTAKSSTSPGQSKSGTGHDLLNYRLTERIGQEELATIYLGTHLALDRPVQVYVLRRTDWISASRFQLAARLAARLTHANLLPVIDAGHDERFGDYLVTPRLDVRSLRDMLAEGPLDPMVALRIFTQIGAALEYLHNQVIIHRDIQPANVLVTPQGTAYLANFSLAAAPDTPDFSGIEEADYMTPYSAPEQSLISGQSSPTQDLYSMGAILYHMLSGELPPRPGEEPPALGTQNPRLTGADRVIRRLMADQPAQRYAGAAQAVSALRQAFREQIDDSTGDMQESHWEAVAEWLENPVETIIGDLLDQDFISRSRSRADVLHRVDAIRRHLDRWSRHGFLRRPLLGQVIQPEQIVSYNVYTYELRAHYETRTPPQPRQAVHQGGAIAPGRDAELWEAPVPEREPFIDAPAETIMLPGSQKIVACGACHGAGKLTCQTCAGKGTVARSRKIKESDGTTRNEMFQENCPICRGYGRQDCARCEGTGQMLEEKAFTWSRHGRVYFNEDDISGLHRLTIQAQAGTQIVFQGQIDPRESRWYQIAPLKETLEEALKGGGADAHLLAAELYVRGVPITEVDYQFKNKPHSLALIGFGNEVRGDSSLIDIERALLYGTIALMALVLVALLLLRIG